MVPSRAMDRRILVSGWLASPGSFLDKDEVRRRGSSWPVVQSGEDASHHVLRDGNGKG